jgi:hypothetical protein
MGPQGSQCLFLSRRQPSFPAYVATDWVHGLGRSIR